MAGPVDLDVIEETARQYASKQKAERTRRRPKQQVTSGKPGLGNAIQRQRISLQDLKNLNLAGYPGPVISFYLSLTSEKLTPEKKEYLASFHSLKHRALESSEELFAALPRDQIKTLEEDMAEIEEYLTLDFDPAGCRSLIIFKSGDRLNWVATVPVYSRDLMVIDPDPYLSPLEEILEEYPPVLVARVRRGEAFFSLYQLGRWQELPKIEEFVAKARTDAGKPGKAQRIYEEQLSQFLKQICQQLETWYEQRVFRYLVLVGEDGTVNPLPDLFTKHLREALLAAGGEDPRETVNDLAERVEQALTKLKTTTEQMAVTDLSQLQAEEKLVFSLGAVVEAMNRSLIRRLMVTENLLQPGYVCRRHQYLSVSEGECPFCHKDLWPVRNLVDSLVEAASRQDVKILVFRQQPELLNDYQQVAAVIYPQNIT